MNWNRGLKRITLILSIVGAVVGAGWAYAGTARSLSNWKGELATERSREFNDTIESALINEWVRAETYAEQNALWLKWSGGTLDEWVNISARALDIVGKSEEEKTRLNALRKARELPKAQGWHTANGDAMPLTPQELWKSQHWLNVAYSEGMVKSYQSALATAPLFGAVLGFVSVWAVYTAIKRGVWPVYKWISGGFREDEPKEGQQTSETDSP